MHKKKKKMTPTFATFFWNTFAAQLCHKSEGFFQESEDFFWACTHVSFQNTVQLCYSCVSNGKAAQQRKWFPQTRHFIDTYCKTENKMAYFLLVINW